MGGVGRELILLFYFRELGRGGWIRRRGSDELLLQISLPMAGIDPPLPLPGGDFANIFPCSEGCPQGGVGYSYNGR